ncbi:hypothetical protein H4R34_002735 [Dimargaris verticillata]|uniref:Uncharacterized protein n=1 Tax=Dimargaris verticillata TaxID=2761393 RepID=A0A9W8B893_9FUNG|nr:hypothetical protein H4R34_002735 [Dimargaris verticillata]
MNLSELERGDVIGVVFLGTGAEYYGEVKAIDLDALTFNLLVVSDCEVYQFNWTEVLLTERL